MHTNMYTDVYTDMYADMYIDMYTGVTDVEGGRAISAGSCLYCTFDYYVIFNTSTTLYSY